MTVQQLDLDNIVFEDIRILIHSTRAGGKTHLAGDMLKHESQYGPVAYVNTDGEGLMTIKGIGLGKVGYKVESLADVKELIKQFTPKKLHAIAVDSVQHLERLVKIGVMGTDQRSPVSTKDKNEWVDIGREFENLLLAFQKTAKIVMLTCPSAINTDQITGNPRVISPDLSGARAMGIAGYVEWCGYIKVVAIGPGKVKRSVQFAPDGVTLVRQQTPNAIKEDITLPDGPGGWALVKAAIINSMEGGGKG